MTDKIDEIRERWRFTQGYLWAEHPEGDGMVWSPVSGNFVCKAQYDADAETIAAAPADIQTLLAEVDRLRDAYDTGYADGAGTRGEHRGVRYKMKP